MSDPQLPLKYADASMYQAAPILSREPRVFLLNMTDDPLGAIAAACRMYEGKPTYRLDEITEDERYHYLDQVMATHLKAPLEFVDFHFFLEGVSRSFTHQHVRQRTAVYAQESLRFAVKDELQDETVVPPSIRRASRDLQEAWAQDMAHIGDRYNFYVGQGIPAEDARELLPHGTLTRLHYKTNLRNLSEHAGNRLCTQAQFHWRSVFFQIAKAILEWPMDHQFSGPIGQWQVLAESALFRPVCYQLGHCPFKATFDRGCTIRGRVEAHAREGTPSAGWDDIQTKEWLLDERAAWQ